MPRFRLKTELPLMYRYCCTVPFLLREFVLGAMRLDSRKVVPLQTLGSFA